MISDYYRPLLRRAVTRVADGGGSFTETVVDSLFYGYIAQLSGSEVLKNQTLGNNATAELFTDVALKLTDRVIDIHDAAVPGTENVVNTSMAFVHQIADTLVPLLGRDYALPANWPSTASYAVIGTAVVDGVDVGFTKVKSVGSVKIIPNVALATLDIVVISEGVSTTSLVVVDGTPVAEATEYEVVWKHDQFHLRYPLRQSS